MVLLYMYIYTTVVYQSRRCRMGTSNILRVSNLSSILVRDCCIVSEPDGDFANVSCIVNSEPEVS